MRAFYLRFDASVSSILEKLVPPTAARRVPAKKEEYAIMYSVSLLFPLGCVLTLALTELGTMESVFELNMQ